MLPSSPVLVGSSIYCTWYLLPSQLHFRSPVCNHLKVTFPSFVPTQQFYWDLSDPPDFTSLGGLARLFPPLVVLSLRLSLPFSYRNYHSLSAPSSLPPPNFCPILYFPLLLLSSPCPHCLIPPPSSWFPYPHSFSSPPYTYLSIVNTFPKGGSAHTPSVVSSLTLKCTSINVKGLNLPEKRS